jgi:hypothetical protein
LFRKTSRRRPGVIERIGPLSRSAVMVVLVERGRPMIATRPDKAFCFPYKAKPVVQAASLARSLQEKFG